MVLFVQTMSVADMREHSATGIRDPSKEVGEPGLPITLFILAVMFRLV